jgi:hypothetical protein
LDLGAQLFVERDQKRDRALLVLGKPGDEIGDELAFRLRREIGGKIGSQVIRIRKGKFLGVRLDEEVERIDHRHVGGEIDLDTKFVGRLGKYETRQPIAVRVLLPIDEMFGWRNLQRIARDRGPAMRRRTEPDDLRPQRYRPVVLVGSYMMQRDEN